MIITLIGMPGCGKSTIGKKIAHNFNLQFVDSDTFIELKYKMTISSIFHTIGEVGFRKIEHIALIEILERYKNMVLSTGGGLPCFFNNMELLNESGETIYLNLPSKALANRLFYSKKQRPLLKNKSEQEIQVYIEKTLEERFSFYNQAKFMVDQLKNSPIKFIQENIFPK